MAKNFSKSFSQPGLSAKLIQQFILGLLLFMGASLPCWAGHIKVAVKPVAPFVIEQDGKFSGYSVDLFNEVARQAGWIDFEFIKVTTVLEMIDALKTGRADIGVGALSITAEQAQVIDFSHSFYDSGLDIMVKGGGAPGPLELIERIFTPELLLTFGGILVALIIVSRILWLAEGRHNHEDFPHHYGEGLIESIWWTTCVLIGGMCMNKDPKGVAGRMIGTVWALVGIAMISYLTATASSIMTVDTLGNDIKGLHDLVDKKVTTLKGSLAEKYLQAQKIGVVEFDKIDDAVDALAHDQVKAVVYDAPILLYNLAENQNKELHVVGHLFDKQKYGFGLQLNSRFRQPLNSALLSVEETDFQDKLDKIYFTPSGE